MSSPAQGVGTSVFLFTRGKHDRNDFGARPCGQQFSGAGVVSAGFTPEGSLWGTEESAFQTQAAIFFFLENVPAFKMQAQFSCGLGARSPCCRS